jgi:hypothetical protein
VISEDFLSHFGLEFTGLIPPPPSPPVYWNVEFAGKILFDLWAAITYGQNLEREGFTPAREFYAPEIRMKQSRL